MTFRLANVAGRAALVAGQDVYDLDAASGGRLPSDPMAAIADFAALHDVDVAGATPIGTLDDVALGSPVPNPSQVFGVGLNYADHIAEGGMEAPAAPVVFTKFPSCIGGPGDEIPIVGESIDYEAEVVVVIGRGGRNIAAADAWSHVAGVTGGQDISDRALQFAAAPAHFALGKSRQNYGTLGPVLASTDSFDDVDDIAIECTVNGEVRQSSSTKHLVFDVPFLIEYLSNILTLRPGDLLFTGTPGGVGMATGNMLKPGDVVGTTTGVVGSFTNPCVAD